MPTRKGGEESVQITRAAAVQQRVRSPGLACVEYVLVYLGSIKCNLVEICRLNSRLAHNALCFVSLLFPLPIRLFWAIGDRDFFFTRARNRYRRAWKDFEDAGRILTVAICTQFYTVYVSDWIKRKCSQWSTMLIAHIKMLRLSLYTLGQRFFHVS